MTSRFDELSRPERETDASGRTESKADTGAGFHQATRPTLSLDAITKVLRVHSGEDFTADEFPTAEEGQEAWKTWKQIARYGYVPGESTEEIQ